VTIRLIAQGGILRGNEMLKAQAKGNFTIAPMSVEAPELYLQGEAATGKISLPLPLKDRQFHLFCSPFNQGAKEAALELRGADVFVTTGKKASAPLTYTTDIGQLSKCDHMLVLLDSRTWTSGKDTAKFVEHIHEAMRVGVHLNCIHEFPSVVGPSRYECEFGLMFGDDWTPAHLTGGKTNLYKEIALALKGVEWRQPGLVAFASKIASSAGEHKPIEVKVPSTYVPKRGPNKWSSFKNATLVHQVEAAIRAFDSDRDFIVSPNELHALLLRSDASYTAQQSKEVYEELLASGYDSNSDGQLSVEEIAIWWVDKHPDLAVGAPASPVAASASTASIKLPAASSLKLDTFEAAPTAEGPAPAVKELSDRLKGFFTPAAAPVSEMPNGSLDA